jgi:hypothetical protein
LKRELLSRLQSGVYSSQEPQKVGLIAARRTGKLRTGLGAAPGFHQLISHQEADGSWLLRGVALFLNIPTQQLVDNKCEKR